MGFLKIHTRFVSFDWHTKITTSSQTGATVSQRRANALDLDFLLQRLWKRRHNRYELFVSNHRLLRARVCLCVGGNFTRPICRGNVTWRLSFVRIARPSSITWDARERQTRTGPVDDEQNFTRLIDNSRRAFVDDTSRETRIVHGSLILVSGRNGPTRVARIRMKRAANVNVCEKYTFRVLLDFIPAIVYARIRCTREKGGGGQRPPTPYTAVQQVRMSIESWKIGIRATL